MATNIGRVEFIVDLDGTKLPAQARALGNKIAAAGKQSGKDFSDGFDSEFEKSLNSLAARTAASMNKAGQLGGEKFSTSFSRSIRRNADKIQGSLGDLFADKRSLEQALDGFADLEEGIKHYETELEALTKKTVKYRNENGKMVPGLALNQEEFKKFLPLVREAAKAVEAKRKIDAAASVELEEQRRAQEALDDEIYRMNLLSRDGSALRQAATRQGKDYALVAADMRREMEGLNVEQRVSNRQFIEFSDTLERTVESLRKADDAARQAADNKVAADNKRIKSERKVQRAQADRLAAAKALDQAAADIDRRMGDVEVYKRYIESVGDAKQANDELRVSFENFRELGGSERQIAGFERRIDSFTRKLDSSSPSFVKWGKGLSSPLSKVTGAWQRMDGTVKLVIASILGAGDQVAVLGSALGAGLVALGGGVTSLIVGAAAGFGVVTSLFQKIEDAPEAMRPTIASFQRLGDAFSDVNKKISQAAFDQIGRGFSDLDGVIRALEPSLEGIGRVLGRTIKGFTNFAKSDAGFALLDQTIKNAEVNLQSFTATVGTFGGALLRAFDRAQPLVEDMFDWFSRLANQFDDFTQSGAFTDWVKNAQAVWSSFSGVLDAVSLALHNLVTPEAIQRTTDLLDNLARMAPGLGEILNAIGTLDPFGVLVSIMADLTDAFIPMAPAATAVAHALNSLLLAIPAPLWVAAATAVTAFVSAFIGIKVVSGVGAMLDTVGGALTKIGTKFGGATTKAKGFAGVMGKLGGGKGLGIAVAATTAAVALDLFNQAIEEGVPTVGELEDGVRGASSGMELLRAASERSATEKAFWGDYQDSLKDLPKLLEDADNAAGMFGGEMMNLSVNQRGAVDSLARLGEGISSISERDMPGAQKAFKSIVDEFNLTDKEAASLLKRMGPLGDSFQDAAGKADGTANATETLNFALGRTTPAAEGTMEAMLGLSGGLEGAADMAKLQSDAMERLSGKSLEALGAVEGVAAGIKTMGSAFRDQRSAARDYETSVRELTESIEENGGTLDIHSEEGSKNQAALDALAQSTLDLAGETYNLTGSQAEAAAAIEIGRKAVIDQLAAFGIVGPEAEAYADKLGLIPSDVETVISANTEAGMEMADAFATRLYQLGLIETDPVATLNAEQAKEEARLLQEQLDAMDTTVHVTTLDANGDPVQAAVESTATSLFEFSNKVSKTTLDANGDPMYAVLDDTANKLMAFDTARTVTTLDANGDPLYGVLEDTANKLQDFSSSKYRTTLDANGDPAGAVVEETSLAMDALAAKRVMTKLDADDKKATEKIKTTTEAFVKLDGSTYKPKLDVNNKDALDGAAAVKSSLDSIKNKTVTITTVHRSISQDERAAGGIASTPTLSWWGEAGPEALVPLNRPLSQVDPAVRALSAIAQGIPYAGVGGFGGGGGGGSTSSTSRVVNIQPGAIVVQGDRAPEATATNVVNRLAQRIAG